MSKFATSLGLALIACFFISCITKATEDEIKKACKNLLELRGEYEVVSIEDAVADIEERYAAKQKEVQDQKVAALQAVDAELAEKLANIDEKDNEGAAEAKKKLLEEIDKKKSDTNHNFDQTSERLNNDKLNDLAEAKNQAAESADEVKTVIDECVSKSLADGMSQKMARCRSGAPTIDKYWNGCGLQ
jgi:exonuclease VII large subunit